MTDLPKLDSSWDNARIFEGLDLGNSMGFQDLFNGVASLDLHGVSDLTGPEHGVSGRARPERDPHIFFHLNPMRLMGPLAYELGLGVHEVDISVIYMVFTQRTPDL
ncbi:hypothetical protein L3X38_010889 [Prunus dulcis]|uniref:Uncharacterized protein n=1 Tax=Prunus dulcis TaxID=3755 RepID=A0AAD4ZF63_PRUDU|nr:hypothetical protein L3X38_010889 [Prunus dulcis]